MPVFDPFHFCMRPLQLKHAVLGPVTSQRKEDDARSDRSLGGPARSTGRCGSRCSGIFIAAVAASWALVVLATGKRPVFRLTLPAAELISAALAVFFILNAPVNAAFGSWAAATLPSRWRRVLACSPARGCRIMFASRAGPPSGARRRPASPPRRRRST
jgi:hypothetical protein